MSEDREWEVAQRVCTPAELEALRLERQRMSQRAIGYALGISREAVRDRLERGARKIRVAMRDEAA